MAIVENDGGGGSTTSICSVSPSDLVGQIDNLITRIEYLEGAVSQILSTDIAANQLSDIAESLGWITDITYMGEDGWIQTPSGTLIPPPGWSGLSGIIDGISGGTGAFIKNRLHHYSYIPVSSVSGSAFVPITGSPTVDLSLNGSTLFTPTTVSSEPAWQILKAGNYRAFLYITVTCSSVTEGQIGVAVLRGTSPVSLTLMFEDSSAIPIASGGSTGYYAKTFSFPIGLPSTSQYVFVRVVDSTDASSTQVTSAEMLIGQF